MAQDDLTVKRIEKMHPRVREELLQDYLYANNKLLPKGVRLRFSYTLRSFAEQNELYAFGRTVVNPAGKTAKRPLGYIVTNAKGGDSIHNYGLAFDIVLLYDDNVDGKFERAEWDQNNVYFKRVVEHFISKGWTWGGNWKKFPDYPHFEKTFGYSLAQLKLKTKGVYPAI